jgi:S1-C subfamily serine protease
MKGSESAGNPMIIRVCLLLTIILVRLSELAVAQGSASSIAAPTTAVERPLAGFGYMFVAAPTYEGNRADIFHLVEYLHKQLEPHGWTFIQASQLNRVLADPRVASATVVCTISHTAADTLSNSLALDCADVYRRAVFGISEKGTGMTLKGDLEAAIRKIAARLQKDRPRFIPAHTVDLIDTLPAVETLSVTDDELDRRIAEGQLKMPVEGVWSDTNRYRLAILSAIGASDFVAVLLEDRGNIPAGMNAWRPGMVKARFTPTAELGTYIVRWSDGYRRQVNGTAKLSGTRLAVTLTMADNKTDTLEFLKLKPIAEVSAPPGKTTNPSVVATGTGFVCAPGLIATNYHVVRDAKRVELLLTGAAHGFALNVVVSDAANDLAVLRIRQDETAALPSPLILSESDLKLGQDVLVVGFPLGSLLGSSHKVSKGIVSALDGINSDPTMMQLTAAIQPGSSGSPVFDSSGRVLGIVTATLNAIESLRVEGHVPQNVNFAVKADYLALLLKRAGVRTPQAQTSTPAAFTDVIEKVRSAVGQIRTYQ